MQEFLQTGQRLQAGSHDSLVYTTQQPLGHSVPCLSEETVTDRQQVIPLAIAHADAKFVLQFCTGTGTVKYCGITAGKPRER